MELLRYIENNKKLKKHRLYLIAALVVMVLSNLCLSTIILNKDTRTILVPNTLKSGFNISDKEVSEEYLELVGRDFIAQVLNMTPENYQYVEEYVLRIAHPASYHILKGEMMNLEQEIKKRGLSLNFNIKQISINKTKLALDIYGVLETRISGIVANREEKRYKVIFDYSSYNLQLKEFYEVKDENNA